MPMASTAVMSSSTAVDMALLGLLAERPRSMSELVGAVKSRWRGETLRVLESLIDRADVVFCQIDGIGHHACREAKHLCRRLAEPFAAQLRSEHLPFRRGRRIAAHHDADMGRGRRISASGSDCDAFSPVPVSAA
jgi:hypothetical protein